MAKERDLQINALTIAAGFGQRMGETLRQLPKGLIDTGGTTIVGRMLDEVLSISGIGKVAITTNAKFYPAYDRWLKEAGLRERILLLNNGVETNEQRLGAIGDIIFALDELNWWDGDLLVLPSDTLYQFKIEDFLTFARKMKPSGTATVVAQMDRGKIANRLGCASIRGDRIIEFTEKPKEPRSDFAIIPFYYYPKKLLPKIKEYKKAGGNLDAPSSIIQWLLEEGMAVYAFQTEKPTLDVGTPADIARIFI